MTKFLSEAKVLDFNGANLSATDISTSINKFMDEAALAEQREERRTYLGASGIGSECLRKIQFDWMRDSVHPARTKRIFSRGHLFEEITVKALQQAGFRMERGTPATALAPRGTWESRDSCLGRVSSQLFRRRAFRPAAGHSEAH